MIKIENLHKYFENKKVLNGVNLDIEEGTSSVIIGGSGTGTVSYTHLTLPTKA